MSSSSTRPPPPPTPHPATLSAAAGLRAGAVEIDVPDQLAGPVNKPCHKDENDKESKEAQEALRRASLLQRLPWLPLGFVPGSSFWIGHIVC